MATYIALLKWTRKGSRMSNIVRPDLVEFCLRSILMIEER
jgi:hypothetical protein